LLRGAEVDGNPATSVTVADRDRVAASNRAAWQTNPVHRAWGSPFTAFNHVLRLPRSIESQRETVVELLAVLAESVELMEPFGRIREAIREAQRIGARGQETHGQAA
jgi:hypothetical protein